MVAHKCTPLRNTVRHRQGAAAVERKAAAVVRRAAAIERKAAAVVRRAAAGEQSGRSRAKSGRCRSESGRSRSESGRSRTVNCRSRSDSGRSRAVNCRSRSDSGRSRAVSGRRASGLAAVERRAAKLWRFPLYRGRSPHCCGRFPHYCGRFPLYCGRFPLYCGRSFSVSDSVPQRNALMGHHRWRSHCTSASNWELLLLCYPTFARNLKFDKILAIFRIATNPVSERTFSVLRRLKTWLHTTAQQVRLNWCTILHLHENRTDNLPMCSVANEFVARNDSKIRIFGHN